MSKKANTIGAALEAWSAVKSSPPSEAELADKVVAELDKRLSALDQRITAIEAAGKASPPRPGDGRDPHGRRLQAVEGEATKADDDRRDPQGRSRR